MLYMVTFTIFYHQYTPNVSIIGAPFVDLAYIPYMDPMGSECGYLRCLTFGTNPTPNGFNRWILSQWIKWKRIPVRKDHGGFQWKQKVLDLLSR